MTPLARQCVDIEFIQNCRDVKKVFLKPNIQATTVLRAVSIGKLATVQKKPKTTIAVILLHSQENITSTQTVD